MYTKGVGTGCFWYEKAHDASPGFSARENFGMQCNIRLGGMVKENMRTFVQATSGAYQRFPVVEAKIGTFG